MSTVVESESLAAARNAQKRHDWVEAFRQRNGRAPRVLHIGNIANNAYNNAKLLNVAGLDCDVICYDYYHVMGCPEWEDADFTGEVGNDFYPAWERLNLNHFRRQKWFAQGRRNTCIRYLVARRQRHAIRQWVLWRRLTLERRLMSFAGRNDWLPLLTAARRKQRETYYRWHSRAHWLFNNGRQAMRRVARGIAGFVHHRLGDHLPARIRRIESALWAHLSLDRSRASDAGGTEPRASFWGWLYPRRATPVDFDRRVAQLVAQFAQAFPDRDDRLTADDFECHRSVAKRWLRLFACYDLIMAYSTDPMLPMIADVPYFALEHGTLREIPFDGSRQGRLTSAAYHFARHVFVTNWDCQPNARILAGKSVTFLNHPFDDDHAERIARFAECRTKLLKELDSDVLIFFPTRHDWVPGNGYADKGNDVLIRAFARLRRNGVRVGMICCGWGHNVAESQNLLSELRVARYAKWLPPLGMVAFERTALASDVVADQFTLGSYGGIMLKSMAAGVPVCTYLEEEGVTRCFRSLPPIINARTEEEIVRQLTTVLANRDKLQQIGQASRIWIKENYASRQTVDLQMEQFRRFFEDTGVLPAGRARLQATGLRAR